MSIGVRGGCILSICVFCSMWNLFGIEVFQRSIVNCSGGWMYPQYMYILGHVKLIWYNSIPYIFGNWSVEHRCVLSLYAFCYRWNLIGVQVFHKSFVNWSVEDRCILSMCVFCYMSNLFSVTVFHRSIVNWSVEGRCILSICVFCYMGNLFGVMVFHTSIFKWSVGIDVSLVYMHSAICETYLV